MTDGRRPITRRDLIGDVAATAAALAVIGPGRLAAAADRPARRATVTLVRDAALAETRVDVAVLRKTLAETLQGVTGKKSVTEAWLSLVKPDRRHRPGAAPTTSTRPTRS